MDPKVYEYFVRVAELKSINRAALALNVSQPSLSRHVAALEVELGTELFVRGQRGVTLTIAGTLLLERVRPLIQQIHALHEELGRSTSEQLILGMPASLRELVTVPVTEEMTRAHGHLQLRVYEGLSNAIKGWIQNGLVDVGLVAFEGDQPSPFALTPLVRESLVLVGGPQSGVDPERPIQLAELESVRFILPGRPNLLRHVAEAAMKRRGLSFESAVEAESIGLCLALVRQGVGHTIVPSSALFRLGCEDALRWAPVTGLTVTWAVAVNEARRGYSGVKLMSATLTRHVRAAVQEHRWMGAELVGAVEGSDPVN